MPFPHWAPSPALHRGPCVHPGDWDFLHLLRASYEPHCWNPNFSLCCLSLFIISLGSGGRGALFPWSDLHTWLQELFCMSGFMNNDLMSLGFYHFTLSNAFLLTLSLVVLVKASITITITHTMHLELFKTPNPNIKVHRASHFAVFVLQTWMITQIMWLVFFYPKTGKILCWRRKQSHQNIIETCVVGLFWLGPVSNSLETTQNTRATW